ncbi:ABC transporter substrate-binding protein [Bacillus salipaludis]|uniref:ABC transporter substrate-binding protein n=1 Tax=Bacillus salipaludis TaxID=2547811 RepID=UPI003D1C9BA0
MRKKNVVFVAFLVLMLALTGCSGAGTKKTASSDSKKDGLTKITFSEPARILSMAPFYVAIAKGYFKEEGIEANIASGGGGAQVVATLLSGDAQFGLSAPASMFKPLEAGKDFVAVQSLNSALTYEIALSNQYLKEKKLSPNASLDERVAALEGATIGTDNVGDSGEIYMRYLMKLHGKDPLALKTVKLTGRGPKISAMKQGIVDGGTNSAPFSLEVEDKKVGSQWIKASEEPAYGHMAWEVVFANKEYLEKNHDLAVKVVRAIGKGIQFTRENPQESAKLIVPYFEGTDVSILEKSLIGMKATFQGYGEMNQELWDNAQEPLLEFSKMSQITKKQDTKPDGIWTNSYIEKAFSK